MSDRLLARRRWRGNLNAIPLGIAYTFELAMIAENDAAHGFNGSRERVAAARSEMGRRCREEQGRPAVAATDETVAA